jgi:AcrR family transcriptional regulator
MNAIGKTMATKKIAKRLERKSAVPDTVRDRILATARELIYREGPRAVGIDRIIAESGVAKMSLYRWFPSKDDLIVAVLQEEAADTWAAWDANMERYKGAPLKQLRAQFAGLMAFMNAPGFRGCAFLNSAMAFADEAHPARVVVKQFKQELNRRLLELTQAIGAKQPVVLAEQLCIVADGAAASCQAVGKDGPCQQTAAISDVLINAQLPSKR